MSSRLWNFQSSKHSDAYFTLFSEWTGFKVRIDAGVKNAGRPLMNMTKQNFDVNNLRVASPCSAGWETMSGDERVRHCRLCKLNVFNISEMSKDEIEKLIVKREGRVCLRLYRRADGTILTKDCSAGIRAYQKRIARLSGAVLAAVLGLFTFSFGQKHDGKSIDASKIEIIRTINQNQKAKLSGTIKDLNGAVIPNVEIKLIPATGKKTIKVKSDENGRYIFNNIPTNIYTLEAAYPEFETYRIVNLNVKTEESLEIDIELKISGSLVMGVYAEEPLIDITSSGATTKFTMDQIEKLPH